MNIAEEKLSLFHEIDELSEESLIQLKRIIFKLKVKQKTRKKEETVSSVWFGIEQWREQVQFNEDDEVLTDEMVASWRDNSSGRDFSWNS